MIFKGSRYTTTPVVTPPTPEGATPRGLAARVPFPAPGVLTHVVSEGERLDQLAMQFYGDPTKGWLILDANADVLSPFDLLVPGRVIRIPQNRLVRS